MNKQKLIVFGSLTVVSLLLGIFLGVLGALPQVSQLTSTKNTLEEKVKDLEDLNTTQSKKVVDLENSKNITQSSKEVKECDIESIKKLSDEGGPPGYDYIGNNFDTNSSTFKSPNDDCEFYVQEYFKTNLTNTRSDLENFQYAYYKNGNFIVHGYSKTKEEIVFFQLNLFDFKQTDLFTMKVADLTYLGQISVQGQGEANDLDKINEMLIFKTYTSPSDCNDDESCKALATETLKSCNNDQGIYTYNFSSKKLTRIIKPTNCADIFKKP